MLSSQPVEISRPHRTVRLAGPTDARLLEELFSASQPTWNDSGVPADSIANRMNEGRFLVLDGAGDRLDGAVHLTLGDDSHIGLLAVVPDVAWDPLSERLLAVAELLCCTEGASRIHLHIAPGRPIPAGYRRAHPASATAVKHL